MGADLTEPGDVENSDRAERQIERWRLRIYNVGFLVAFALHVALNGIERPPVFLLVSIIAILFGIWTGRGPWLRIGALLGIGHALVFPVLQQALATNESIAAIVARGPVWPQLLVTLIGSRVLATEGRLSFAQFWRRPTQRGAGVEMQSIASAVCLGAFLTLLFYLLIPHLVTHSGRQTSDIIVSALLGGTIVHSAIIFLFFVIVAAILDAVQLHARDRAILASFGREIDDDRKVGAKRGLSSILSDELGSVIHTRAFRLLNAAIESKTGDKPPNLAALAFDGFQAASRQFVRALLPFPPLLGFLGTVIGLATAISELPRGLTEGSGQAFDISASLSGLAVKFETTLLGLMASMISSLCLHFLEKREAELAAACMLLVREAGERDA